MSQDKKEHQPRKVSSIISEEEATQLCQSGEWITDKQVRDRIEQKSKDILAAFPNWPSSNQTPDARLLTEFFQLCPIVLSDSEAVAAQHIAQRFDITSRMEIRIRPGVIFKAKSAALDLGINGLALILAIFSTTTWAPYFSVWLSLSFAVLIRTLYKNLESIRDPDEKAVFEAIFRSQARCCIVNYAALLNKQYDEAYGLVCPSVDDLSTEIKGQLSHRKITKALASLKLRGIVKDRNKRWSISF